MQPPVSQRGSGAAVGMRGHGLPRTARAGGLCHRAARASASPPSSPSGATVSGARVAPGHRGIALMAFTEGTPKGVRQCVLQVDERPLPSSPRLNGFFHLLLFHKDQRKKKDSRPSEPSTVTMKGAPLEVSDFVSVF